MSATRGLTLLLILLVACGDDSSPDVGLTDAAIDAAPGDVVSMDAPLVDAEGLDAEPGVDAGPGVDSGPAFDAGPRDAGPQDAGPLPDFPADWPRSRAWEWVRNNDPFVSALSVRMGPPPAAAANRYFDEFNANAVHLWQTGLPEAIAGWKAARPGARWLTWVDSRGNSSTNNMLLGGAPRPAGLIGYQIGDEPRDRAHFTEIMAGLARVREADPEPLRVFNFTYLAPEIDAFLREACAAGDTDIFSYDRYSFGNGQFSTMMKFRNASFACGIPAWRYMRAYRGPDDPVSAASDLRWDAFSGLLAGFTGHSWFLYNVLGGNEEGIPTSLFSATDEWNAATTAQFTAVAQVNRELIVYGRAQTRLRSTGVAWAASREIPGTHPPDDFPAWRAGAGGDTILQSVDAEGAFFQDVLLGFYDDRFGDHYLMVMNPNHEEGSFPTDGETPARITLGFDFAGAAGVSTTQVQVLRPTGVVEILPVSDGVLNLNIAAGDLVFLKYDTGRGFEGYR